MTTKTRQFIVTWEIDIYADNAKDAAEQALNVQRDVSSQAKYFKVKDVVNNMSDIIDLDLE